MLTAVVTSADSFLVEHHVAGLSAGSVKTEPPERGEAFRRGLG